ncbi:type II secretion system protein N [Massilia sp. TS11]|uniref:type II secretion system protein N n=1 Tax=Massilia sp. TS11 TaxID=2908003 RepID=UPI001EDA27A2|nr:type II secretion system protein N [Massilia sp. TS11]MCG2585867.1 hypothetical protein [Massilia sp. TS11]
MKRLPFILGLLAVVALSSSLAYWGMQWWRPAQRPLAALPAASVQAPPADAAATLFGGQAVTAVASNYQLKGVVAASRAADGVAIIAVDGKAPAAYKVGKEVAPGVTVQEVQARFVLLAEGPAIKRIELPPEPRGGSGAGAPAAPATPAPVTPMTPPPVPQTPSMPPTSVTPTPSMMMPPPQTGSGNTNQPSSK